MFTCEKRQGSFGRNFGKMPEEKMNYNMEEDKMTVGTVHEFVRCNMSTASQFTICLSSIDRTLSGTLGMQSPNFPIRYLLIKHRQNIVWDT